MTAATHEGRALRRQHARSGRHRRRQGRRADQVRLLGQRLRDGRSGKSVSTPSATPTSPRWSRNTTPPTELHRRNAARRRKRQHLVDAARIELGIKNFLVKGGFGAFTTTFENLYGMPQLPGLACQRLMQQGFGFGPKATGRRRAAAHRQGDGYGLPGGTSFMEDYTYDFTPGNELVIGAHMLEVCPSIARRKAAARRAIPRHRRKDDPARLLFSAKPGPALNASLIDMGDRFRLIVNEVEASSSRRRCPSCRSRAPSGKPCRTSPSPPKPGSSPVARTTRSTSKAVTSEHLRIVCRNLRHRVPADRRKDEIPAFKNEIAGTSALSAFGLRFLALVPLGYRITSEAATVTIWRFIATFLATC
jgi:hypothetical protein